MPKATTVQAYFDRAGNWRDELGVLRDVLRQCDVEETIKWGAPCYSHAGTNVVGLAAFKSYFGLWFFDGVHLSDPDRVLINAQEGKTKSMRQWRFASKKEIRRARVRAYVKEAIEVARRESSKPSTPRPPKSLRIPPELAAALDRSKRAIAAFDELTPGRQREYAEYITEAKQEATKLRRVKKILPMIREGRGLNDKYR